MPIVASAFNPRAPIKRALERFDLTARDRFRFGIGGRRLSSLVLQARGNVRSRSTSNEIAVCLVDLARAARAGTGVCNIAGINSQIETLLNRWSPAKFDWDQFFPKTEPASIAKAIILKKPQSDREKGVLFVAFETHWIRLFRHANIDALARDYDLVLSPTWSPPQDLAFFFAVRLWPNELFTILSNFDDVAAFERISPKVRPIPLLASNWVNPDLLTGSAAEKKFDIVMLANFSRYKRHFALFRALSEMNASVKALLLGGKWESRTRETLQNEADMFGVRDRITIKESLPDAEMFHELRSAKVSVIMSLVEGSCVAVAEALFANVPVGLLQGARIGSSAFINSNTGRFLRPNVLAADLSNFLEHYRDYEPRKWALANGIGCSESSVVLNDYLRRAALARGHEWTVDIVPFHWRPNATFLKAGDQQRILTEYVGFRSRYGVDLQT